jgi:cell division protein FtsN
MAKDYKAYSNKTKPKSSSKPKSKIKIIIWIIIAIVLVLGFIKILHELSNKSATQKTEPVQQTVPQKKIEEKPPKVKFEFYNMLPKDQVTTTEANPPIQVAPIAPSKPVTPVLTTGTYIVQVASVRAMTDAEALRAKLMLSGFDASIQKTVAQGVTWYRVNIGPVATKDDAVNVQTNLRKNNIDSLVKKVSS